jgi:hypothetical protein
MRARLRVEGLTEAIDRVDLVGERARAPEPVLRSEAVRREFLESERRKFDRGGWRRDTPRWVAYKRAHGFDVRTLRMTGQLERQLTIGGPGTMYHARGSSVTFGVRPGPGSVYYAQPLAKGSATRPARRMVVFDTAARMRVSVQVERYIADGIVR